MTIRESESISCEISLWCNTIKMHQSQIYIIEWEKKRCNRKPSVLPFVCLCHKSIKACTQIISTIFKIIATSVTDERGWDKRRNAEVSTVLSCFTSLKTTEKSAETWRFDKIFLISFYLYFACMKYHSIWKKPLSCTSVLICDICPPWCSANIRSYVDVEYCFGFFLPAPLSGTIHSKSFSYYNSQWTQNSPISSTNQHCTSITFRQ